MLGLLLLASCALARYVARPAAWAGSESYVAQRLDHFNAFDRRTFQQRYFVNEAFARPGARAAVLEIGGEGEISGAPGGTAEKPDVLGRIAQKHGATIYQLEHRFYGRSHPFPQGGRYDTSAENLRYLTSRQAIGDLLSFMDWVEERTCAPGERVPGKPCLAWVVVGGSYPGALAGWITEHHPSRFVAGLSSSGVVDARYENPDFDTHTLAAAGSPCGEALRQASQEIIRRVEAGDREPLDRLHVPRDADRTDFYYFLADASLMCLQYGHASNCCDRKLLPAWESHAPLDDALIDYLNEASSFSTYDSHVLGEPLVEHDQAFRQWWSQTCLEMAYFQPAPELNSIRSPAVSMEWHLDMCRRLFGWELGDPTVRTNEYYGGAAVVSPDCFFSNFYQDIWHLCGKTEGGDNVGYIMCRDCAHCCDLHADSAEDPPELTELRERIVAFVEERFARLEAR